MPRTQQGRFHCWLPVWAGCDGRVLYSVMDCVGGGDFFLHTVQPLHQFRQPLKDGNRPQPDTVVESR